MYGIDIAGDTISTITPVFIVTTVPGKSVRSHARPTSRSAIRFARRRSSGRWATRLQTPPASLDVVRQPDSIVRVEQYERPVPGAERRCRDVGGAAGRQRHQPSGAATTPRAGVKSIIVRYVVTRIFPATASIPDTTLVLVDDAGRFLLPTGRTAADTTDAAGSASRQIRAIPLGFDSVEVSASANNLRGIPLRGSPIRFVVTTK